MALQPLRALLVALAELFQLHTDDLGLSVINIIYCTVSRGNKYRCSSLHSIRLYHEVRIRDHENGSFFISIP